jgi:FHS family L-fucose permease-like MFS transporter
MQGTSKSLFEGKNGENYLLPFILVTSLFFLWGFAHALLDVLNKHFQEILHISKARSAFVQLAVYGGYFTMAIPSGLIIGKFGYKKGIVFGLFLFALGAFLFYPSTIIKTFPPFLLSLFVIACGLTCLETAANPYTTFLGPPESAARRINFAQSFNGLGWIFGPLIGGVLIFSKGEDPFAALARPYIGVGIVVLAIAAVFIKTPLPEIAAEKPLSSSNSKGTYKELLKRPLFVFSVIAQFFYVAGQTGIGSFFINYVIETNPSISPLRASMILALGGMGMFMVGRFVGSYIMKFFNPRKLLGVYAFINVFLMMMVVVDVGIISIICLFLSYFFMSIMYPTIFACGINGLGANTGRGSSLIVMAIAGGALIPMLMGHIADVYSMATGFMIPMTCFAVIAVFGFAKLKKIGRAHV